MRIAIIGGGPAGYSAAKAVSSIMDPKEDSVLLVTDDSEIGYCLGSLPLLFDDSVDIENTITGRANELEDKGINVYTNIKITDININERFIILKDQKKYFDKLIIAIGSGKRSRFNLTGSRLPNVFELSSFADGLKISPAIKNPTKIVLIGSSYVGTEVSCIAADKHDVTLLDSSGFLKFPGYFVDPEIEEEFRKEINKIGVNIDLNVNLNDISIGEDSIKIGDKIICAPVVIDALGGDKDDSLAFLRNKNINFGKTGLIKVNDKMETSVKNIYAAGTCSEFIDFMGNSTPSLGEAAAHLEGWAAGLNAMGTETHVLPLVMPGLLLSNKFELGYAGYCSRKLCKSMNIDVISSDIESLIRPKFYKYNSRIFIRLFFEKNTKRIVGGVLWGKEGVRERIGIIELALKLGATSSQLSNFEGAFIPNVNIAPDPISEVSKVVLSN